MKLEIKPTTTQIILLKEFISYMAIFYIPTSTPAYIILRETMGYSMLWSYLIGNTIAGIVSFIITKIIWNNIKKEK